MGDTQPDVLDAAAEVVILAFDLAEGTVQKSPRLLADALQSGPVQEAVKKTLLDYAKSKAKPDAKPATGEEGRKLLESLGSGIQDAGSNAMLNEIKKSPAYKRLEKGVTRFKDVASKSPLGVWVDENKNILYIVGAGLIVGASSVLYVTRTGGQPVKTIVDFLKEKEIQVLQVGTFRFKASLWDFQPDARVLGARIVTAKQWEKVSLELKLGVLAREVDVEQVDGSVVLKSGPVTVNGNTSIKPVTQQVDLGLRLDYSGRLNRGQFNIGVGAIYKDEQLNASLKASLKSGRTAVGLEANAGPDKNGAVQYGGLLTLSVDL